MSEPRTWVLVPDDVTRPPMLANEQRKWTWRRVRDAKAAAETLAWALAKQAKLPRLDRARVDVTWYAPNAITRDADGLGPFLKAVLDGLTKAGVFVDDNAKYVPRVGMGIEIDRRHPRIEITITEIGDPA